MKICVVGSGGREHALVNVFHRQGHEVVISPGNAGIPQSVSTAPADLEADLFVVGPEQPLVEGLADTLRAQGKLVFGPGADGAQLEGSKAWMKDLLKSAGVPTADYRTVTTQSEAEAALEAFDWEGAIKTDGLAAGKGVAIITGRHDIDKARADIREKLSGKYDDAGKTLVIEKLLPGYEVSLFAICNGTDYVLLDGARDYKRLLNGDDGPNTGGMGSYSPAGTEEQHRDWAEECIKPVLEELVKRGIDYRGVLYAGLMITPDGPKVLEFNIRFGDPEIQSVAPRVDTDFAKLLLQAAKGEPMNEPEFSHLEAVTVVLAADGYPENPRKGDEISLVPLAIPLEEASPLDPQLTYAGVSAGKNQSGEDCLLTAGGRVMAVTCLGKSTDQAREQAYSQVSNITWQGMQYRTDIAEVKASLGVKKSE